MRLIKIGLANLDTTVGAFRSNTDKIIASMEKMSAERCTLGVFSEQAIAGYASEDFSLWKSFVAGQWEQLERARKKSQKLKQKTVFILGLIVAKDKKNYNCGAVICDGKIIGIVPKEQLPEYEVFYEKRIFSPCIPYKLGYLRNKIPFGDMIFEFPFGRFALDICRDSWEEDGPTMRRAASGAEMIVNISSSPYRLGMARERRKMILDNAKKTQTVFIYANQCGGNDSLVFDGGGFICQNGKFLLEAKRWQEGISFGAVDLDLTQKQKNKKIEKQKVAIIKSDLGILPNQANFKLIPKPQKPKNNYFDDIIEAMIAGLDGFFNKNSRKFTKIGIALSGGKDSALTLILAWMFVKRGFSHLEKSQQADAIKNFIYCFSFPTRFNKAETKNLSRALAKDLGARFTEIAIEKDFGRELKAIQKMAGADCDTSKTTVEHNIQARIRGQKMQNWANATQAMWLQSGNMSEKAVGYTAVGGDMLGDFSLIGNLPKTMIIAILDYINQDLKLKSISEIIQAKPSAELEAGQEDEKDLMPYEVLDDCIDLFFREKLSPEKIYKKLVKKYQKYKASELEAWVNKFINLFSRAIYKWEQAPQAVHLNKTDLDRGRAMQLPIIWSKEWLKLK